VKQGDLSVLTIMTRQKGNVGWEERETNKGEAFASIASRVGIFKTAHGEAGMSGM